MTEAKISQAEALRAAAIFIANTIDPTLMGPKVEEVNIEKFAQLFIQKAEELLGEKGTLILTIGSYFNPKTGAKFSEDLALIIEFVEAKTQMKYHFFNGALVYIGGGEIGTSWIPDRPL